MRQDTRETEGRVEGEPPGADRELGAGRGQKKGGANVHGKRQHMQTCDAGAQRREAEAGGWWVWETSRFTEFRTGKGGG